MDENICVTGIVLSSMPYKDKDRIIHIFSVELGVVSGILKGVMSPNSKMKFASQPFCFGKFDLTKSKDMYIVKGVELIETFFDITNDYDKYKLSSLMLEICKIIMKPNIISESLFISLLKSLQGIVYEETSYKLVVTKFLLRVLDIMGYGLNFETCDNCGLKFMGDIKFDAYSGSFRCYNCSDGQLVSKQDFVNLKIISATDFDRLKTIKVASDSQFRILELLILDLSTRLNVRFKSISAD